MTVKVPPGGSSGESADCAVSHRHRHRHKPESADHIKLPLAIGQSTSIIMGGMYNIFGRQVPAYQLSIAVFASLGLGVAYATSGKKTPAAAPPIQAESSDEMQFITDFLKKQEAEAKH